MPRLTVLNDRIALEFRFDRAIRIGRHIANSLPLPDREVSRQHAQIFPQQDRQFAISDLGSRNGIYVNGRRIKSDHALNPGDEISMGMTLLLYERPEGKPIKDLLSHRGMRIWDDIDHHKEVHSTEATSFGAEELDDLIARWLRREDSPPLISHRFRSELLDLALSLGKPAAATELGETVLRYLQQRIGGDRMAVQICTPGKKELKTLAQMGNVGVGLKFARDIVRVAFESTRAVYSPVCETDYRFRHVAKSFDEFEIGTFVAAPIVCGNAHYGFIYLDQAAGDAKYDFKALVQTYLAASLLGQCLHWYFVGLEG